MARISIQIEGMSITEAAVVMEALAGVAVDANKLANAETKAQVEASAGKIDELVNKGRKQAAAEKEDDLPGDLGQGGKGSEPKPAKQTKKAGKKKEPKKDPEADQDNVVDLDDKRSDDLIEKLSKFTKLVDVIEVMRESGLKDGDDLIAECERIKGDVPVLKKIPNITDRVKRVLERLSA